LAPKGSLQLAKLRTKPTYLPIMAGNGQAPAAAAPPSSVDQCWFREDKERTIGHAQPGGLN
jgi:hypothetical protein